jgi:transcriptional regulator with XRE-family HTH domain
MTEQEIFGERLRRRRMALGLNQQQLAERLGWQAATISRYERGRYHSNMNFDRLRQLALALATSTDYLLGLTHDPGPVPDRTSPGEECCFAGSTLPLVAHPLQERVNDGEYTTRPVPAELPCV